MNGALPMPGGWAMSSVWLPQCGQSWPGAALCFAAMWGAMMVPMMLPAAFAPLSRYRRSLRAAGWMHAGLCTLAAGLAWMLVWAALGLPLYALGAALAQALLASPGLARAMPPVSVAACMAGAAWHLTTWPRRAAASTVTWYSRPALAAAWRYGVRLGAHCIGQCAGLTVALLGAGIMDRRAMACAAVAVLVERLLPRPQALMPNSAEPCGGSVADSTPVTAPKSRRAHKSRTATRRSPRSSRARSNAMFAGASSVLNRAR
jgi:predicted metal-binding membrane protein